MTMLQEAARLAFEGYSIFPCRNKLPLTQHGFKDASNDAKVIADWWARWPEAQIAVATGKVSGLFVLDVDGPEGEALVLQLNLPETRTIETRPGRKQLWFQQPEGVTTKSDAGVLAPQLDRRGDGGYVIAPPSIHHETGQPYRIARACSKCPRATATVQLVLTKSRRAGVTQQCFRSPGPCARAV